MAQILRRLTVSGKLAISSTVFVLPIAVLLYFLASGINRDIRFSTLELYGDAYQRPLEKLLDHVPRHALARLGEARGQADAAAMADLARRIDEDFGALAAVDKELGADLQFTPEGLGSRNRSRLRVETVRAGWQAVKVAPGPMTPALAEAYAGLTADIRGMISHAGDTSNLILDPDLDSYYLMDVTLLALPQTQDRLAAIIAEVGQAVRRGGLTAEERSSTVVRAALLKESDQARVLGSMATALSEDQNFYGRLDSFQQRVPAALEAYDAATAAFIAVLEKIAAEDKPPLSPADFVALGLKAREASFALWDTAAAELDRLLAIRIDSHKNRLWVALAGTALALLVAAALVVFIGRSIVSPVKGLAVFTRKVTGGDLKACVDAPEVFTGEFAGLCENVQDMVEELKRRLGFAQGLLEGLTLPCAVVDMDGRLSFVNARLLDMLGCGGRSAEFAGRPAADFFSAHGPILAAIEDCLTQHTLCRGREYQGRREGGEGFCLSLDVAPMFDLDGQQLGVFAIMADMTTLKAQEAELKEKNAAVGEIAREVEAVAGAVGRAMDSLNRRVDSARRGADVQNARIGETASAMDEMSRTVLDVARSASQAASHADTTKAKATAGAGVVETAVAAIRRVSDLSALLKENMGALGRQAQAIGQIMTVISDIADQTNLLALNAAIEAARAGDAGRGFAVVADEVRKLAEKTMSATREVGSAIASIQDGAATNVKSVDEAVSAVAEATRLAHSSGAALNEIVGLVEVTTDQVRGIATASEEQSAASEEIKAAIEDVARVSEETSQGMGESSRGLTGLSDQVGQLRELVGRLRAI